MVARGASRWWDGRGRDADWRRRAGEHSRRRRRCDSSHLRYMNFLDVLPHTRWRLIRVARSSRRARVGEGSRRKGQTSAGNRTFRIVGTLIQFPSFPLGLDFVGNLTGCQQATGFTTPSYFLPSTGGSRSTNAHVARSFRTALDGTNPARVDTSSRTSNKDQTSIARLGLTGLRRVEGLRTHLIAALAIILFVTAMLVQRSTERATVAGLGFGRRLNATVLSEPIIIAATGTVIGARLGVPMAYLFVQILGHMFVVPPTTLTVPGSQALLLVGMLLLTITASAVTTAIAVRRVRLVELLRAE